ncbi:uncharacterized protein B0T15DRAFT_561303 [Chaetomium strumarium]|uniref:Uncharacterized protein n=1 Tax=Chaetomium strumarium TaxID=1170767 RepID=A0AAJ0GPP3_9PEZI|nr:hypothetical protein B0T15DRAFT_561303 [Chaetomium strumarium]
MTRHLAVRHIRMVLHRSYNIYGDGLCQCRRHLRANTAWERLMTKVGEACKEVPYLATLVLSVKPDPRRSGREACWVAVRWSLRVLDCDTAAARVRLEIQAFIKDGFSLPTLLALGGVGQAIVSCILPARYALLPLAFLLLRAVVVTCLELASPPRYSSKLGVIRGRFSAQLPNASYDPSRGDDAKRPASPFGSTPAEQGIVMFHIGARINHPLGALAPAMKEFGDLTDAVTQELQARADEFGCLGMSAWRAADADSLNTSMAVIYFRDFEGLNRFAHDKVHRQVWDWYRNVFVKKHGYSHVGIFHEAFYAVPGAYETIYENMPPTLMSRAEASVRNEATGREEWVGTVVDASVKSSPAFRTQYSRLNRVVKRQMEASY